MSERRDQLNLSILDYGLSGKTFMPFHFGDVAMLYALPGMIVVTGWQCRVDPKNPTNEMLTATNRMTAAEAIAYLKDVPDDDLV